MTNKADLLKLHLSVILFGCAGLFAKLISNSALYITAGRLFFAFISLFILALLKGDRLKIDRKSLGVLFISGVILAVHWFSFFQSIKLLSVSIGLLLFTTYPVFTALIDRIVYRNRLQVSFILVLGLNLTGLYFLTGAGDFDFSRADAYLYGILSGFSFALLSFFNKHSLKKIKAETVNLYQFSFAFLIIFVFANRSLCSEFTTGSLILLIVLGVVFTALSHTLFVSSFKKLNLKSVAIITCLEPVYGIILAQILIGFDLDIKVGMGALLIISAALFESLREIKDQS